MDAKGLRELLEKATPGPWLVRDDNEGDCWPPRPLWCVENEAMHTGGDDDPAFHAAIHYGGKCDAELIAAMHEALPTLLSELDRLRGEVAGLRENDARYRWLRERWGRIEESYLGDTSQMESIREAEDGEGWEVDPTSLDDCIDAAIKESANGQAAAPPAAPQEGA